MNKVLLKKLTQLVCQKSEEINITSIRDYDSIWEKHIQDSLMLTKVEVVDRLLKTLGVQVLDVGTGAGFPGLPLAIHYPRSKFTLIDSTRKKVEVVREFASKLGLSNVEVIWTRAEDLRDKKYDVVMARSVTYLPKLLKLCLPLVKKQGMLICYKTCDDTEIAEGAKVADDLGVKLITVYRYELSNQKRVILAYGV